MATSVREQQEHMARARGRGVGNAFPRGVLFLSLMIDHAGNGNPNTKAPLFPKLACLLSSTAIYALQEGEVKTMLFQQVLCGVCNSK